MLTVTVAASEKSIRSDTTFRLLWILVAIVVACPFFVLFVHWAVAGTSFAFGPRLGSRFGPGSAAGSALMSLGTGCALVYGLSRVQRTKQ